MSPQLSTFAVIADLWNSPFQIQSSFSASLVTIVVQNSGFMDEKIELLSRSKISNKLSLETPSTNTQFVVRQGLAAPVQPVDRPIMSEYRVIVAVFKHIPPAS